jgi:hypothetical protein
VQDFKVEGPVRKLTEAEVEKMSLQERCDRILDEFDEGLAIRRLQFQLSYEDLSRLNDDFRDYFSGMRTARRPGDVL